MGAEYIAVEENSSLSIPHHSLELRILQTSLHRILHKNLALKSKNKVQLTEQLKPPDHEQQRLFADWVLEMHENAHFIFRDEAYFHLNKQNCRGIVFLNPIFSINITDRESMKTS